MTPLRIVIIEDEPATARNLAYLLQSADANISLMTTLATVKDAVEWLRINNGSYDLIFMDIRLGDGQSFDIFKQVSVLRPVIFVTAYNDYAIQAFKNNGIDYILKPFDEDELLRALDKYKSLTDPKKAHQPQPMEQLMQTLSVFIKPYKKSFLVHYRDKLIPVESAKIAWFYTANEIVYANTVEDKRFTIEFTMEQLEQQLEPDTFFRANRQFIINRKALAEADFYFNGRLALKVLPEPPEKILISKARVAEFKLWMER